MIDVILQVFVCMIGPPPMRSWQRSRWFRRTVRLPKVPAIGEHVAIQPGDTFKVEHVTMTPGSFDVVVDFENDSCEEDDWYQFNVGYWLESGFHEVDHYGQPVAAEAPATTEVKGGS